MSIADIRNYGAVGDGVTDCTSSIQDAINACVPGDMVLISEGLFLGHKGMIFMESAYKEAEPKPEMIPPEVSDVRLSDLRIDSPDRTAVYIHGLPTVLFGRSSFQMSAIPVKDRMTYKMPKSPLN